ncbi:hypothetical protein [Larkinella terrae]|uniref:Uncharacterized protein n=1 Tax=Larkinella terrae TaxID=2025311 RepID=A0A7K0EEG1_9BACT|nr:hypothetical protein [Larkinella terrae]MRS60135.1 hypothetical protein [Larkinella terrae]
MATIDDEWESLFRNRLENYDSEPNEDALERILKGANPPPVAKPGGNWGNRFGWGLSVLAILGVLTFGVWQYKTLSAHTPGKSAAVSAVTAKNETAQAAVTVGPADAGRVANLVSSSKKHTLPIPAEKTGVPLAKRPAVEKGTFAGLTGHQTQKPVFSKSKPGVADPQATDYLSLIEKTNQSNEKPYRADEVTFTINQVPHLPQTETAPELVKPVLTWNYIAGKTAKLAFPVNALPTIIAPVDDFVARDLAPVIEPERRAVKPSFFTSLMPLYTFRQVTPMQHDNVVVEKIRPSKSLSARKGYRFEAGVEFPLTKKFGLRVGATYQKLQQEMTYSARALRSDSSRVEWVDPQTIKLTPLYKSEERHVKNTWQYVALSAEGRLQLNPGQVTGLRHYIAAGGSIGYLMSGHSKERWQPFLQASYGIERQLTDRLRLQIEPGIVYNLSAINDNSRCFSVRPYSYGLVVGLRWQP